MENSEQTGENKPHFNISAFVVKQLGDELISDEVTALMELVKNSYDADADYVSIIINPDDQLKGYDIHYKDHKGFIVIDDNGDGMDANDIEKGWLTISISKKREMKLLNKSTKKGRTPLGEKGLGRLSTQRLATKLELITKKQEAPSAYHVYFNWNDFNESTLLSDVKVQINPIEKSSVKKGTRLILLDLKDSSVWRGESVEKIKGKLSQLIFPKKRKRPFTAYLEIGGTPVDLDYISENIKQLAISRYSFTFYENVLVLLGRIQLAKLKGNDRANYHQLIESDNGKAFFDFISNPTNKKGFVSSKLKYVGKNGTFIEFKREISVKDISEKNTTSENDEQVKTFLHPGNFRGKIDEYNFTKDVTESDSIEEIFEDFGRYTSYIKSQTGIRVFRDGFGIRPFGLDGEDWLKLHQAQTSGSSYYGLRPGNVIGFIEIGAKTNPSLHEKTDREGIIDNAYYKNFYLINRKAVSEINFLLEDIKRAYNEYRKIYGIQKSGLHSQVDVFNLMKKTGQKAATLIKEVQNLNTEISTISNSVENEVKLFNKAPSITGVSDNAVKNILENVTRQLKQTASIINQINILLVDASKLSSAANILEPQINTLQDQLSEFSQLAGLGLVAESLSHEMDNILDGLSQRRKNITTHIREKKYNDSVLFTFIEYVNDATNSLRKQASHLSPILRYLREEKHQISISDFLQEIIQFHNERLQGKIDITLITKEDLEIQVNKGKLTQIFDNLIFNSEYWLAEFAKTNNITPKITIEVNRPFVLIHDNGLGIDPSVEEKLFQPFVTAKPKRVGRGLGLFIVQQLLEANGGDIILLPNKNMHGRRFTFQINFNNLRK